MATFTKESLERLRSKVDLGEVISSHIQLKASGSVLKACCPFHEEKTPSFTVQRGDAHYHCFGCGAHGDAIQFLMEYQKLNFSDAVVTLAERFSVPLEQIEEGKAGKKEQNRQQIKQILDTAQHFFTYCLLHTSEGHEALSYLYERGINLEFIHVFGIGWAPKQANLTIDYLLACRFSLEEIEQAGLCRKNANGTAYSFFSERITFPIHNSMGGVIGFSARKFKEEVFGGKYINSPETTLFKKSKVLFGLNYARRRIVKEQKALIVEGQLDALRLISSGLNITVAALGTAFGEEHVQEIVQLGVQEVWLAFDGDRAGKEASRKVGHLFQKRGIEVFTLPIAKGEDPDSVVMYSGIESFLALIAQKKDYLSFLVDFLAESYNVHSPAGKTNIAKQITKQIKEWEHPLMVHESLQKLSLLLNVPKETLGALQNPIEKKYPSIGRVNNVEICQHRILESDLLRWLILQGNNFPQFLVLCKKFLSSEYFYIPICRKIYDFYLSIENQGSGDILSVIMSIDDSEIQLFISDLLRKKVNAERAPIQFVETVEKMREKHWNQQKEYIRNTINETKSEHLELEKLVKSYDEWNLLSLNRIPAVWPS